MVIIQMDEWQTGSTLGVGWYLEIVLCDRREQKARKRSLEKQTSSRGDGGLLYIGSKLHPGGKGSPQWIKRGEEGGKEGS